MTSMESPSVQKMSLIELEQGGLVCLVMLGHLVYEESSSLHK